MKFHRNGEILDPLTAEEYAAAHTHDASVTSVGIREAGPLDLRRLEEWMGELLRTRGPDIFRMKGVLHIRGVVEHRFRCRHTQARTRLQSWRGAFVHYSGSLPR